LSERTLKTRPLADNRSNSIIVFGAPDAVARINSMVDQLDRKPLQVYLATVIGQLTRARESIFCKPPLVEPIHGQSTSSAQRGDGINAVPFLYFYEASCRFQPKRTRGHA